MMTEIYTSFEVLEDDTVKALTENDHLRPSSEEGWNEIAQGICDGTSSTERVQIPTTLDSRETLTFCKIDDETADMIWDFWYERVHRRYETILAPRFLTAIETWFRGAGIEPNMKQIEERYLHLQGLDELLSEVLFPEVAPTEEPKDDGPTDQPSTSSTSTSTTTLPSISPAA